MYNFVPTCSVYLAFQFTKMIVFCRCQSSLWTRWGALCEPSISLPKSAPFWMLALGYFHVKLYNNFYEFNRTLDSWVVCERRIETETESLMFMMLCNAWKVSFCIWETIQFYIYNNSWIWRLLQILAMANWQWLWWWL